MSIMKEVGANIRHWRKLKRLTLQEMAALTGFSAPTLCNIERGLQDQKTSQLVKIAAVLNISPKDLFPR